MGATAPRASTRTPAPARTGTTAPTASLTLSTTVIPTLVSTMGPVTTGSMLTTARASPASEGKGEGFVGPLVITVFIFCKY